MKNFIELYQGLDETKSSNKKIDLLVNYFGKVSDDDAAWAVFFLSGHRLKRFISYKELRNWSLEAAEIPKWLFTEVMVATGDSAEGIALVLDTVKPSQNPKYLDNFTLTDMIEKVLELKSLSPLESRELIIEIWTNLDLDGMFIVNKLLTGEFRVGVSKLTVANALAKMHDLDKNVILHRMMGIDKIIPTGDYYQQLTSSQTIDTEIALPYPYFLASQLEDTFERSIESLGDISDWIIEWKWDGIRAQIVKRNNEIVIWSRGEEIINQSFPEIVNVAKKLPDNLVLDGEILAYHNGEPLAFALLQKRIGRENVTQTIIDTAPVIFMVYDMMEWEGVDIRDKPLSKRKEFINNLFLTTKGKTSSKFPKFIVSQDLTLNSWDKAQELLQQSREHLTEGFVLKRRDSEYKSGRVRGDWWKAKIDPLSIDAVLIYAMTGSGRRANLFTAYTFGVWNDQGELVPVGRAYRGLTDAEIKELNAWIRAHTKEKFGPTRIVEPYHVFELGFDGIMSNKRSKVGLSLRFPRIIRWRKDKKAAEADTVERVQTFLKYEGTTEVKQYEDLDDFFS